MCIEGGGAAWVCQDGVDFELAVFRVLGACHGDRHEGGGCCINIDGLGSAPPLQQRGLP